MAKAEPQEVITPERAAEMEAQLATFRQQQAAQQADERKAKGKPLFDLVNSPAFAEVAEAVPAIDAISSDPLFPSLRTHIDALRHGLAGLRLIAGTMPADPDSPTAPPVADTAASGTATE